MTESKGGKGKGASKGENSPATDGSSTSTPEATEQPPAEGSTTATSDSDAAPLEGSGEQPGESVDGRTRM
jgi:hypothetical protein